MSDILSRLGKQELDKLNNWVRLQAADVMDTLESNEKTANKPKVFLMALCCHEDWAIKSRGHHFAALCIPRRRAVYVVGIGGNNGEDTCKRLSMSCASVMFAMFDSERTVESVEAAGVQFFLSSVSDDSDELVDFIPPAEIFDMVLALPSERHQTVLEAIGRTILRVMGFKTPSRAADELSIPILEQWGAQPRAHSNKRAIA